MNAIGTRRWLLCSFVAALGGPAGTLRPYLDRETNAALGSVRIARRSAA